MSRAQRLMSKWAIPVVALILPLGAFALGLGEARVESFLNQPLDVRMRLLDVSEDDLDSLTVAPASPEDHQRLGLMSDSLALGLEISVDRSVSPPIVRVSSARPVSDPVVQLLVDARWASGRMLREYTLFLDPPTVEVVPPPAPAAATPPPEESARVERSPGPRDSAPARQAQTSDAPRRPVAAAGSGSYGPVATGDTLWSIASANLPASDVTMDQMMIAIVELNPGAFRDQNINQLLRGARLQLPDAEQVRALDAAAAAAEVAAQNRAFGRRMGSATPVVSGSGREPAISGSPASEGASEQTESGDAIDHRLSLVPPGDGESGSGVSEDASEVADLRQRLARAEEELYAARQEAEEFESQVEELEALVAGNPAGIGIRDADLAGLEATLRAAREATRADADPGLRADVSARLDQYLEQYEAASPATDAEDRIDGPTSDEPLATGTDSADDVVAESGQAPQAPEGAGAESETAGAESEPAGTEPEGAEGDDPAPRAMTEIETSSGFLSSPVLLLVIALVVLLVILAIARWVMQRRGEKAEPTAPLKRAADLPRPAPRADDPVQMARDRLKANPEELAAHLALLRGLAAEGMENEFSDALESMFEHVESESEREWLEAVDLAGGIVPGHSLVKGSSDWVSEVGESSHEAGSEVDQESEVDDLMSRLDSDLEESDDLDWLGGDETDKPDVEKGPLLREDQESGAEAGAREAESASDEDEFDLGGWRDEDEQPDSDQSDSSNAQEDEVRESGNSDDLVLDWPDEAETFDRPDTQEHPRDYASGDDEPAGAGGEEAGADDDIFAQSDDDIDVKLDLAKAYLSWNSNDSARTLLQEVVREGNAAQQEQARTLLDSLDDGLDDDSDS